jgi:hypothetical protein
MAYIYDLSDTWNASGTTFTAIKMNVTDTASAAASLLMDLQVGGTSRFSVAKGGIVTLPQGGGGAPALQVTGGGGNSGFGSVNGYDWFYSRAGSSMASFGFNRFCVGSGNITWASSPGGTADILLTRDAANTLAQRNGVNAQAFNLYNTYTDASNYERARVAWVSNGLVIGTQPAGTGTPRGISLDVGGTATRLDLGGGIITFINAALNLGGITSAFPALKRSTTTMQVRLADDSAFTNIQGKLTTDTAYTAGAPTATGYIVLFDSTGTAYRVPAVAN